MRRWRKTVLLSAGACLALAACTSGGDPASEASTTALTETARAPESPIRGCENSVFGTLAADWRTDALVVGPIAWVGLKSAYMDAEPNSFVAHDGRYWGQKALAVVEEGQLVRVELPESEREYAAIDYSGSGPQDNQYELSDGRPGWTFSSCLDRETQFNGVFVVTGPRCLAIDVLEEPQDEPTRAFVPFGTQDRPCPPNR